MSKISELSLPLKGRPSSGSGSTPRPGDSSRPGEAPSGKDSGGAGATSSQSSAPPRRRSGQLKQIENGMADIYSAIGGSLIMLGQEFDGELIVNAAEPIGVAWADLAEKNESVKRVLLNFTDTGAWGSLIFAHAGIAVPIMMNHGWMPRGFPFAGITPAPESPDAGDATTPPVAAPFAATREPDNGSVEVG